MSHSKRNTSRSIFTSHERSLARAAWGSSTARLGRDSFLPFASCSLCLEPAVDPVACAHHGDVFCRECALSNILAQRAEIRRLAKAREAEERGADEDRAREEAEARERAVKEFELTQMGLEVAVKGTPRQDEKKEIGRGAGKEGEANGSVKRGEKRKFSLDGDEVARIAAEERAKMRKAIEEEKATKPALPSFWTPSVTPTTNKDKLHEVKKKTKTQPICPASAEDKPHPYSMNTLVTINFTEEDADSSSSAGKSKTKQRICPACKKALTNASKAMLAKPCGHVLCRSCVDKFVRPAAGAKHDPHAPDADPEALMCYVCDADLTDRGPGKKGKEKEKEKEKEAKGGKEGKEKERIKPGLVELRSEGTGFSASGVNEVKKDGVGFQC